MVSVNCRQAKPCAESWNALDIWNETENSSWLFNIILHTEQGNHYYLPANLLDHPSVISPVLFFVRHFVVLRCRNKMHENFVHLCPPFWKNTNLLYIRVMDCNLVSKEVLKFSRKLGRVSHHRMKDHVEIGHLIKGEKLNYNSCTSLLLRKSQNLLFWLLKSSGHQSLPCLFDSRFL